MVVEEVEQGDGWRVTVSSLPTGRLPTLLTLATSHCAPSALHRGPGGGAPVGTREPVELGNGQEGSDPSGRQRRTREQANQLMFTDSTSKPSS